jgi:glycosyltransferase involved in cell wall biosynthesis
MSPFEGNQTETVFPPAVERNGGINAAILYDLIPLLHPQIYLQNLQVRNSYLTHVEFVRNADLLLSISESAREDAIRHLQSRPDRVVAIGTGVSDYFSPAADPLPDQALLRARFPQLAPGYLFTVLGEDPRKNLPMLLDSYGLLPTPLRRKHPLVIGGSYRPQSQASILAALPNDELRAQVLFTGHVDDECLRALYRCAGLFVFPSIYEGFGLPVAEAIACGCPAVCSNTSSLPEILNDSEALFDPSQPQEIAARMEQGLQDQDYRKRLQELSVNRSPLFRWDAVAGRAFTAMQRAVAAPRGRLKRKRPSIALIGPFPPHQSGIADYNQLILPALAEYADVYAICTSGSDPISLGRLPIAGCFTIAQASAISLLQALDCLLYSFGNSAHHIETQGLFTRFPGVLWLHDVRLQYFYHDRAKLFRPDAPERQFLDDLIYQYGPLLPEPVKQAGDSIVSESILWSLGMTREMASHARHVIVHSQHAQRLFELDQGPDARLPGISVLPLASCFRPELPLARRNPRISTFGLVNPVKAPELLMKAFAQVRKQMACKLSFVGPTPPGYQPHLERCAATIGVAGDVEFSGFVSSEDWEAEVLRSGCAVQLRTRSNGESSASVLSCLSRGVPVITNVLSCAEMPEDSRVLVSPACDEDELAAALLRLMTDATVWDKYHQGGLAYARETTPQKVAVSLLRTLGLLS